MFLFVSATGEEQGPGKLPVLDGSVSRESVGHMILEVGTGVEDFAPQAQAKALTIPL